MVLMCWGYCGDTTYISKDITLPITFNQIFSALSSTKDTSDAINNRIKIKNLSTLNFSRSGEYNVTGWFLIIGY